MLNSLKHVRAVAQKWLQTVIQPQLCIGRELVEDRHTGTHAPNATINLIMPRGNHFGSRLGDCVKKSLKTFNNSPYVWQIISKFAYLEPYKLLRCALS